MFKLTDSTEVPGVKPLIQVGYPDKMTPDICLVDSTNIFSFVAMNSTMLREALLADPTFTLVTLGIKVEDVFRGGNK